MGSPRCKWVRDRLPLLVGDDLRGADRRRVERHLIGCPSCRQHRAALVPALEALRIAAATAPARADAPSLWPALARQIREERRTAPTSPIASALALFRINPRPALGFGLGLALLIAAGTGLAVRPRPAAPPTRVADAPPPTSTAFLDDRVARGVPAVMPPSFPVATAPALAVATTTTTTTTAAAAAAMPKPPRSKSRSRPRRETAPAPATEAPIGEGGSRLSYDLDLGRPMPEASDARDTRNTH